MQQRPRRKCEARALWRAIWCKFRGDYFPLLICRPQYAHTDGHSGPITVCLVERRASVPSFRMPIHLKHASQCVCPLHIHWTFTSHFWPVGHNRYKTTLSHTPSVLLLCSISSYLVWCDNKVDALKCKPGYSEALKPLIRNVSREVYTFYL